MVVDLYEDNAGGLFVHKQGSDKVYQDDPCLAPGSDFQEVAFVMGVDMTITGWSDEWIHPFDKMQAVFDHSETHKIATYDSESMEVTVLRKPGLAGKKYLKLTDGQWNNNPYPFMYTEE